MLRLTLIAITACIALCFGGCTRDTIDLRAHERTCSLHDSPLHDEVVPINYSLFVPADYLEAEPRVFPNAHEEVHGGLTLFPDPPHFAHIRFCDQCRRAQVDWWKNDAKWVDLCLMKSPLLFERCRGVTRAWLMHDAPWWFRMLL